jgi:hypothetical protein
MAGSEKLCLLWFLKACNFLTKYFAQIMSLLIAMQWFKIAVRAILPFLKHPAISPKKIVF